MYEIATPVCSFLPWNGKLPLVVTTIVWIKNNIFDITINSDERHLFAHLFDPGSLEVLLQSLRCRNRLKLDVAEALL